MSSVAYNKICYTVTAEEPLVQMNVLEFIERFEYRIDKLYVDKFWASIDSEAWILVDNEMLQWIGYNDARERNNKLKYTMLLERNFKCPDDYNKVNKGSMVKGCPMVAAHNCLSVHPDVFKKTLMMIRTEKAEQIRDYYIALERIMRDYLRYTNLVSTHNQSLESNQLKQQMEQYKAEMNQLKSVQDDLAQLGLDTTPVELSEYVYILTSKRYYPLNLIKIGKTINLKNRLSTYNTGNALDDDEQFYLCSIMTSDSHALEKQLHRLLKAFLYRKEWYRIQTSDLLKLVQFITAQQESSKVFIDQMINTQTEDKPVISLKDFMDQTKIVIPDDTGYHMKDNKYFCSTCNKDYLKLGGMMNHINGKSCKESKVGSYECSQCSKQFNIQHYYDKHISDNNCTQATTYTCDKCDKTYTSRKCYESHVNDGCTKKFSCNLCKAQFTTKYGLAKHGERKIPCVPKLLTNHVEAVDDKKNHSVYRYLNQLTETDYGTILAANVYSQYTAYCNNVSDTLNIYAFGRMLNAHDLTSIRQHKGRSYVLTAESITTWITSYLS